MENRKGYDIEDILRFDSVEAFIQNFSKDKGVIYGAAHRVLLGEKGRKIYDMVRELRKLEILSVDVYFLTPIGLFRDTDLMVPYRGCMENISSNKLRGLFEETGLYEHVTRILLDHNIDIFIVVLDMKIIHLLKLEDMYQENRKYFIITDKPYFPEHKDVIVFYPGHYLMERLKELNIRPRLDRFKIDSFSILTRLLIYALERYENLELILDPIKNVDDVIDLLKMKMRQTGDISRMIKMGKHDVLVVSIPKRIIETTNVEEMSPNNDLFLLDERIDLGLDKIGNLLSSNNLRIKFLFLVNKNIKLPEDVISNAGAVEYNVTELEKPQPLEIRMLDRNRRTRGWIKGAFRLVGEGKIVLILYPLGLTEDYTEYKNFGRLGYFLELDEVDICSQFKCKGDFLIVRITNKIGGMGEIDRKLEGLLENFELILALDESNKLLKVYSEKEKLGNMSKLELTTGLTLNEILNLFLENWVK